MEDNVPSLECALGEGEWLWWGEEEEGVVRLQRSQLVCMSKNQEKELY